MTSRVLIIGCLILLLACSVSTFGKFMAKDGVPIFIKTGETKKKEVLDTLGEPLGHRIVAGRETVIYNHEQGKYWGFLERYEGNELVIRFENGIVGGAKVENTGSG